MSSRTSPFVVPTTTGQPHPGKTTETHSNHYIAPLVKRQNRFDLRLRKQWSEQAENRTSGFFRTVASWPRATTTPRKPPGTFGTFPATAGQLHPSKTAETHNHHEHDHYIAPLVKRQNRVELRLENSGLSRPKIEVLDSSELPKVGQAAGHASRPTPRKPLTERHNARPTAAQPHPGKTAETPTPLYCALGQTPKPGSTGTYDTQAARRVWRWFSQHPAYRWQMSVG